MPPKTQTNYTNIDCKDKVWNKGKEIPNKNPNLYRKDAYGHEIYKPSYGTNGSKSWQIDHKIPTSRGGSNNIRNLQPLQSTVNMSKGNTLVKKKLT